MAERHLSRVQAPRLVPSVSTTPTMAPTQPPSLLQSLIDALKAAGSSIAEQPVVRAAGAIANEINGGFRGKLGDDAKVAAAVDLPFLPKVPLGGGALDTSLSARMGRAAEQGFDTSRKLYHGTGADVKSFEPGRRSIYLTDKPEIADIYADASGVRGKLDPRATAGPNVMPVYAKAKKPLVISDLGPDGKNGWSGDNLAKALGVDNPGTGRFLHEEAKRQGYDLLEIRDMSDLGGRQSQFIPLDPSHVRSVNAAFDPAKASSSDLVAGLVAALGGGAIARVASGGKK